MKELGRGGNPEDKPADSVIVLVFYCLPLLPVAQQYKAKVACVMIHFSQPCSHANARYLCFGRYGVRLLRNMMVLVMHNYCNEEGRYGG